MKTRKTEVGSRKAKAQARAAQTEDRAKRERAIRYVKASIATKLSFIRLKEVENLLEAELGVDSGRANRSALARVGAFAVARLEEVLTVLERA